MKTLSDIPDYIRQTFTIEEKETIKLLEPYAKELTAYFRDDTGEFDCIGFVGEESKVTKFADIEKYNALLILENRVRRELRNEISKLR